MKDKTTTIRVKTVTRKRLHHVCELIEAPDYDSGVNALLDRLGYPSWAEVEKLSGVKASVDPAQAVEVT